MINNEIVDGLKQLGFNLGWVVTGDQITLWEHSEPQPTDTELLAASKLYAQTLANKEIAKQIAKQAILNKIGLTQDEAEALLG